MHLTPFGYLFLPIVLAALAFRRSWLFPLLIIAAALHAPAVAILGANETSKGMGITPWLTVSFAIFIHLILIVKEKRRIELGATVWARRLFIGWTVFFAWSVVSAFTLPFLFEGVMTYNAENIQSIAQGTEPLVWRGINAVQAINFAILYMLMLYAVNLPGEKDTESRIMAGFLIALYIALSLSLLQRFFSVTGTEIPAWISTSLNPSYYQTLGYGLDKKITRIGWPFAEPSYASVWFAGVYAGGLGLALLSRHLSIGLGLSAAGFMGVANSLGGTGMASFVVSTVLLIIAASACAMQSTQEVRRTYIKRLVLIGMIGLTLITFGLALSKHEKLNVISLTNIYERLVLPRINDSERRGNTRSHSNREAVRILEDTKSLGVGLGSNRASSYILNMASNLGILAATTFLALVLLQSIKMLTLSSRNELPCFIVCGTLGCLTGMIAGIPDLNFPAFWIWLIASMNFIQKG